MDLAYLLNSIKTGTTWKYIPPWTINGIVKDLLTYEECELLHKYLEHHGVSSPYYEAVDVYPYFSYNLRWEHREILDKTKVLQTFVYEKGVDPSILSHPMIGEIVFEITPISPQFISSLPVNVNVTSVSTLIPVDFAETYPNLEKLDIKDASTFDSLDFLNHPNLKSLRIDKSALSLRMIEVLNGLPKLEKVEFGKLLPDMKLLMMSLEPNDTNELHRIYARAFAKSNYTVVLGVDIVHDRRSLYRSMSDMVASPPDLGECVRATLELKKLGLEVDISLDNYPLASVEKLTVEDVISLYKITHKGITILPDHIALTMIKIHPHLSFFLQETPLTEQLLDLTQVSQTLLPIPSSKLATHPKVSMLVCVSGNEYIPKGPHPNIEDLSSMYEVSPEDFPNLKVLHYLKVYVGTPSQLNFPKLENLVLGKGTDYEDWDLDELVDVLKGIEALNEVRIYDEDEKARFKSACRGCGFVVR